MGRYAFSNRSKLIIEKYHWKDAYTALDFVDDDDKSDEENLIDCLADFQLNCVEKSLTHLTFVVSDKSSDEDFDWQLLYNLRELLLDGSFYEEIHYDQNRILVGTIHEKKLFRDFYELISDNNNTISRGNFLENFDIDLSLD